MKYSIGLDLGGTNSVFGIVNTQGQIVEEVSIKTKGYKDATDYVNAAVQSLSTIIEKVGGIGEIDYMGIGAPNGNVLSGCIEFAPNISWAHDSRVPLAQMFSERLGELPVTLTNDANAAAIGEMTFGVAKGMRDFIVLTLGTGVGSGIVCNGELVYGSDGNAGELGHLLIRRGDRLCGCGRRGCLETYCSATGVVRTAQQFCKETAPHSFLHDIPVNEITSYDVAIAAQKGDQLAKQVFDYTGQILGEACAEMSVFTSPEAFILFGGLAKAGKLLLEPTIKAYEENVMPIFKGKVKFLISSLDGAGAAVLGAASLRPQMRK